MVLGVQNSLCKKPSAVAFGAKVGWCVSKVDYRNLPFLCQQRSEQGLRTWAKDWGALILFVTLENWDCDIPRVGMGRELVRGWGRIDVWVWATLGIAWITNLIPKSRDIWHFFWILCWRVNFSCGNRTVHCHCLVDWMFGILGHLTKVKCWYDGMWREQPDQVYLEVLMAIINLTFRLQVHEI